MSVKTFDASQPIIVTSEAATHFADQLKNNGGTAIRLSLKEAGCTGFKYVIEPVDMEEKGDIEVRLENAVKVFIDSKHLEAFKGMKIDYVKQGLNYILELKNPNVKEACGCGESFNV